MQLDISGVLLGLQRHARTHPNIVSLWRAYLLVKQRRLIEVMAECEAVTEQLAEAEDLDDRAVVAIYAALECMYGGRT